MPEFAWKEDSACSSTKGDMKMNAVMGIAVVVPLAFVLAFVMAVLARAKVAVMVLLGLVLSGTTVFAAQSAQSAAARVTTAAGLYPIPGEAFEQSLADEPAPRDRTCYLNREPVTRAENCRRTHRR